MSNKPSSDLPNMLVCQLQSLSVAGSAAGAVDAEIDITGAADQDDVGQHGKIDIIKKPCGKKVLGSYSAATTSSQLNTALKKVQDQQVVLNTKIIEADKTIDTINNEIAETLESPSHDFVYAMVKHIAVDTDTVQGAEQFNIFFKAMAKAAPILLTRARDIERIETKGALVTDLRQRYNKAHRDETLKKELTARNQMDIRASAATGWKTHRADEVARRRAAAQPLLLGAPEEADDADELSDVVSDCD